MKKILLLPLIIIIAAVTHAQSSLQATAAKDIDRGYIVKTGDYAPSNFKLKLTNGATTSLEELRGKVVILQFTASWCSVCREEMPHLEAEIWQAYKDKGVILIGVDRDEPLEKVIAFQKAMNITYPLALDPGADIFGLFANKKSGVTRNVVNDRDGRIAYLTRLYDQQEFSGMLQKVQSLITNPTETSIKLTSNK